MDNDLFEKNIKDSQNLYKETRNRQSSILYIVPWGIVVFYSTNDNYCLCSTLQTICFFIPLVFSSLSVFLEFLSIRALKKYAVYNLENTILFKKYKDEKDEKIQSEIFKKGTDLYKKVEAKEKQSEIFSNFSAYSFYISIISFVILIIIEKL